MRTSTKTAGAILTALFTNIGMAQSQPEEFDVGAPFAFSDTDITDHQPPLYYDMQECARYSDAFKPAYCLQGEADVISYQSPLEPWSAGEQRIMPLPEFFRRDCGGMDEFLNDGRADMSEDSPKWYCIGGINILQGAGWNIGISGTVQHKPQSLRSPENRYGFCDEGLALQDCVQPGLIFEYTPD